MLKITVMSSKTLTLYSSSSLFLNSFTSLSLEVESPTQPTPPPLSFSLLSDHSPLPPIPPDFPQSKLIPKTRFVVDGFRHAGNYSVSYFLSHFHSDHYTGLNPNWCRGVIFCSEITARLLVKVLNVSPLFVFPLPLSETVLIDGCQVSLVDANHCPGAVQFLFKTPEIDGKCERYVHTGDFRYCDSMKLEPVITDFVGSDAIFLDTTYCNPKFVFPSQEESIDYIVGVIQRIGVENEAGSLKSVLFLVATYVIGKEKILLEIARRCNRKIHVDSRKFAILNVLGIEEGGVFTEEESESDVHVVGWNVLGETWPYFRPNFVRTKEIMNERGYSKVVGFVPTGWTYEVKHKKFAVRTKDSFEIHLVPYSEHSNYDELREYVKFLKPKHVFPTVGVDVEEFDSKHANALRKHFAGLVDEMAVKQEFLMGFHRGCLEMLENDSSTSVEKVVTSPELKSVDSIDTVNIIDPPSSGKESDSRYLVVLNDNDSETEEIMQELRDCLPTWVTRNMMLDLLIRSGRNVVEAVSYFYEREIEFHEQVITSTSQTTLMKDSVSLNKPCSAKGAPKPCSAKSPPRSVKVPLSHGSKSPNTTIEKSSSSPVKKNKSVVNRPNKKARTNSRLESSGPKQYTITRFFSKTAPKVSHGGVVENVSEKCSNDEDSLPSDAIKSYEEDVDQFIQIINGSALLRSYATTLMEETKGDVNKALDIYYNNPHGDSGHRGKSVESSKLVQAPCSTLDCSFRQESTVPEESRNMVDLSLHGLSTDNVIATSVSLAPEKYFPIEHACWRDGQPAPYLHIARTFDLVEDERGKIKATSMLCNMFRSLLALSPVDVLPAVYLCTNKIAPDHENMELNIGGTIVTAALEEACGTNRSKIKELYNSLGDLGDVAQLCRQTQSLLAPPSPLSIQGVFSVLRKISVQTGNGSTGRKKSLIVNLMRSCREKEMKFLVRTLVRNLRIGAMMRTVLPALAQAVVMNAALHKGTENLKEQFQSLSAAVVEAYNILPNLDLLVPSLMDKGIGFSSTTLSMVPGIPIKPMLAKITNGIPQVLKLFQNKAFSCEYKYDGQRAQIHRLADGFVRVFSRNGDETTSRFPDLVNIIKESCSPTAVTFILDAEVVAVDRRNGSKLMSFQELSSRERGSKDALIAVDRIKVDICVFVFDIMFANGEQ